MFGVGGLRGGRESVQGEMLTWIDVDSKQPLPEGWQEEWYAKKLAEAELGIELIPLLSYTPAPRWNGLPCRWYRCPHCSFQVQLGSEYRGARAMGKAIIHPCDAGAFDPAFKEMGEHPIPVSLALLSTPWRAVEMVSRLLSGAPL